MWILVHSKKRVSFGHKVNKYKHHLKRNTSAVPVHGPLANNALATMPGPILLRRSLSGPSSPPPRQRPTQFPLKASFTWIKSKVTTDGDTEMNLKSFKRGCSSGTGVDQAWRSRRHSEGVVESRLPVIWWYGAWLAWRRQSFPFQ